MFKEACIRLVRNGVPDGGRGAVVGVGGAGLLAAACSQGWAAGGLRLPARGVGLTGAPRAPFSPGLGAGRAVPHCRPPTGLTLRPFGFSGLCGQQRRGGGAGAPLWARQSDSGKSPGAGPEGSRHSQVLARCVRPASSGPSVSSPARKGACPPLGSFSLPSQGEAALPKRVCVRVCVCTCCT